MTALRFLFPTGRWLDDKVWDDEEIWRDNLWLLGRLAIHGVYAPRVSLRAVHAPRLAIHGVFDPEDLPG